MINLEVKLSSVLQNTVATITALPENGMCRTRLVPRFTLNLSPSLADEREGCVRDMQVTTRYFIGPGKYPESLRVLRETIFRAR